MKSLRSGGKEKRREILIYERNLKSPQILIYDRIRVISRNRGNV